MVDGVPGAPTAGRKRRCRRFRLYWWRADCARPWVDDRRECGPERGRKRLNAFPPEATRGHGTTVNKSDIVDTLAERLGYSKAESRRLLDTHLEAIAHQLAIGNRVVVRGLGTFATREVPAHRGRRPGDGRPLDIPARRQVTFRPAQGLRDAVQARKAQS